MAITLYLSTYCIITHARLHRPLIPNHEIGRSILKESEQAKKKCSEINYPRYLGTQKCCNLNEAGPPGPIGSTDPSAVKKGQTLGLLARIGYTQHVSDDSAYVRKTMSV